MASLLINIYSLKKTMTTIVLFFFLCGCCQNTTTRPERYPFAEKTPTASFQFKTISQSSQHATNFPDFLMSPNTYALGLSVEGKPLTVYNGQTVFHNTDKQRVAVKQLLYATATHWKKFTIYEKLNGMKEITEYIAEAAKNAGLSVDQPFPFRLEGHMHITPSDNNLLSENLSSDQTFNIIGFWLTPEQPELINMHFQNTSFSLSGRLKTAQIMAGTALYFPILDL